MSEEFRVAAPSNVEPFRKLTVPAGTGPPLPVTAAVNVSICPEVTGFGVTFRTVAVDCAELAFTVSETADDVLDWKLPAPAYCAVRLYVPTGSDVLTSVVAPELFNATVPRDDDPFRKVTEPVGVVEPALFTFAVRESACPAVTGFGVAIRVVVVGSAEAAAAVTVTGTAAEVLA